MGFRCQKCNAPQEPRVKPRRVVVETRKMKHGSGFDTVETTQIAREEDWCQDCYQLGIVVGEMHKLQEKHESRFATIGEAHGD